MDNYYYYYYYYYYLFRKNYQIWREREREIKYLYRKKIFEKLAPNWKSLFSCLLLLLWLWLLHIVGWLLYFIPS